MTLSLRRKGWLLMAASLLVQAGQLELGPGLARPPSLALGFVAGLLGMLGASFVARAKGYSQWVGLLGLLSFVGLGLVLGLPEAEIAVPAVKRALSWPWSRSNEGPKQA